MRIEEAFPAIVSKTRFRRVNSLMRSRAPRVAHPRRVASSYLLSGLVKCKACNRALSGQDAKSGQFSYYVCQSIMKRGQDACKTPRLNARRFEEMVVGKIRSNVLTDANIRALVKVVDEQMDGVAQEQRTKLETIEDELEDVKRKLGRIWHFIETADNVEMTDASDRIREHRGPPGAPGGLGGRGLGHPLAAQGRPGRRGDHRGLRPGHERVSEGERADRAQGLHRNLRQGDRRHARRRPTALHHTHFSIDTKNCGIHGR